MAWARFSVTTFVTLAVVADALVLRGGTHALGPSMYGCAVYMFVALVVLLMTRASPAMSRWSALGLPLLDVPLLAVMAHLTIPILRQPWHILPATVAWSCGFVAVSFFSMSRLAVAATAFAATASIVSVLLRMPGLAASVYACTAVVPLLVAVLGSLLIQRTRRWLAEARQKDVEAAAELGERIEELQIKERELEAVNRELRRQVAEKSRALLSSLGPSSPPEAMLPAEGELFDGRYRVVRALGRGGMGAVFEVRRLSDDRALALKVMTGAVDTIAATRFLREAELAARLDHGNLVSVVDVGTSITGTLYLVMELVAGHTVEQLSAKWGDRAWALDVLGQVARGIEALHREDVVHRDLKPANVLIRDRNGRPEAKVSDFGIARRLPVAGALDDTASPGDGDFTRTGVTIGTPKYLPPDAVGRARSATPETDAFSFGVMACEVLCGAYPFSIPPALEVLAGREPSPPDTSFLGKSGLPARLVEVLIRCLAPRPGTRPTATELAAALDEALLQVKAESAVGGTRAPGHLARAA